MFVSAESSNRDHLSVSHAINNSAYERTGIMNSASMTPERETAVPKRGRDGSSPYQTCEPAQTLASTTIQDGATPKKTRSNDYRPPQKVPPSFTSQVGSLAISQLLGQKRDMAAVGLRRQLSSSKIEEFLSSGEDAMDVDAEQTRPRSMSL